MGLLAILACVGLGIAGGLNEEAVGKEFGTTDGSTNSLNCLVKFQMIRPNDASQPRTSTMDTISQQEDKQQHCYRHDERYKQYQEEC